MATMEPDDPAQYGRVIRDAHGNVERVVEAKGGEGDATAEQLAIREVNTGIYAFDGASLKQALGRLDSDNAQGELYLPDVLPQLTAAGQTIAAHLITDSTLTLGVNDRNELAQVRKLAQRRIHEQHGAQRGHDRRSRRHLHRRRRHDRPGHDGRARDQPAGQHDDRRGVRDRPAHDDHRLHDRRRRERSRTATSSRRRSRTTARSARSPTCAPTPTCSRTPRRERSSRSRTRRSAPGRRSRTSPTSATPTSASTRTSARATSPPTTTAARSTALESGPT